MKNSLFDLETVREEAKKRLASKDMKHLGVPQAPIKKAVKKIKEEVEVENVKIKGKANQQKVNKKLNDLEVKFEEHKKNSPKKAKKMIKEALSEAKEVKPSKMTKVKKMKEEEKQESKPVSKAGGESILSKVQAIRKEKGISLKEAWAELKSEK